MATPSQIALSNQSVTFEAFADDEKLTITEVSERVNEKLKAQEKLPLSEQTIRRAIKSLIQSGFIKEFGRKNNAVLYGKLSASWASQTNNQQGKLIPLAGNLTSVEDFLRIMVSPDQYPLKLNKNILSNVSQTAIRKYLAYVVFESSKPGMSDSIQHMFNQLTAVLNEVKYLESIVEGFLNSPVWHSQYRDRIGYELREMQKKNPELYQLTLDFIQGG